MSQSDSEADVVSLWESVVSQFGGPTGFSKMLKLVFNSCDDGSANQVRMAIAMLSLHNDAAALTPNKEIGEDASMEEMEAALGGLLKQIGGKTLGK